MPGQDQRPPLVGDIAARSVQDPRVAQNQLSRLDWHVDLCGIVAEHNGMVFFDEARTLLVRGY